MSCLERRFRATIACMAVVLLVADRAIAQFDGTPSRLIEATEAEHSILVELQLAPASRSKVDDLRKMLQAESPSIRLVVDSRPAERNVALVTVWPDNTYEHVARVQRILTKWGVSRVFIRAMVTPAIAWKDVVVVAPDDIYVTLRIRNAAERKAYQDVVNRITTAFGTDVKVVSLTMGQGHALTRGKGQHVIISAEVMAGHNVKHHRIERVKRILQDHGVGSLRISQRRDPKIGRQAGTAPAGRSLDVTSLRKSVEREFELRQAQQRQELTRLKERLARIERLIEERERNRERIIERRVEELRNPALRWEATDSGR